MLIANNITKTGSQGQVILDGISLTIEPGKITTLIGVSGSGKTTALRALSMLDVADSGVIKVDDRKYQFPLDRDERRKPWPEITAVFQQFFLWPHLTLRQNILLPTEKLGLKGVNKHLKELFKLFDMSSFIDSYPNQVSGGQKQRAAVARALILQPKYILLDEITSALDIEQSAKVLECLEKLKEMGIGILLITHFINFAKKAADHVVFLDSGKITEHGGKDILKNPKTKRLKQFLAATELAS